MENKVYLKRTLIKTLILFLIFLGITISVNKIYYQKYTKNYNEKIASIIYVIKEKNLDLSDTEIAQILNSEEYSYDLKKYGIDIDNESIIYENDNLINLMLLTNTLTLSLFFILLVIIYLNYSKNKDKKINEIDKMIKEISEGNYKIDFESKSEDELSILRDNLYKITLKLKEERDNSLKDKKDLKENLENISHQLKTPLTAISLSVDNILDSSKMTDEKRRDFLIDIKREVNNINFLIKGLLELSRFEANVVKFDRKENDLLKIVKESIKKVDLLRDLKNIEIEVKGKSNKIICDYNWEIEAISNIIKNAIEHSHDNSKITIEINKNEACTSIKIINNGNTIDEEDLNNIFKRFYNGKNSTKDSIGIGLSLTKSIIEKDNGKIFVESKNNETIFEIIYYSYWYLNYVNRSKLR